MPDPLAVSLVLWGRKGMIMAKPQATVFKRWNGGRPPYLSRLQPGFPVRVFRHRHPPADMDESLFREARLKAGSNAIRALVPPFENGG
jgi:hypothetical protein